MLSPGSFIVLHLHLGLRSISSSFLWRVLGLCPDSFSCMWTSSVLAPSVEKIIFVPSYHLYSFVKDQLTIFMRVYLWLSILFHWSICLFFHPNHSLDYTVALSQVLRSGSASSTTSLSLHSSYPLSFQTHVLLWARDFSHSWALLYPRTSCSSPKPFCFPDLCLRHFPSTPHIHTITLRAFKIRSWKEF